MAKKKGSDANANPLPLPPQRKGKVYRDRIVGQIKVMQSEVMPHPLNPRIHPVRQAKALIAILDDIGIASGGVARWIEVDGEKKLQALDGHLRRDVLADQEQTYTIVDLNDEEAAKFILAHDPIAMMAEVSQSNVDKICKTISIPPDIMDTVNSIRRAQEKTIDQVNAIVKEISTGNTELAKASNITIPTSRDSVVGTGLQAVVNAEMGAAPAFGAQTKEENFQGIMGFKENVVFPSSNQWGIPDLRSDRLCSLIPKQTWGAQQIKQDERDSTFYLWSTGTFPEEAAGGVLGFYIDDYRFDGVWNDAVAICAKLVNQNWGGVCTPDFSVWWDWPLVMKMWNLYKSRWVARYWQEAGIKIIPSLMRFGDPTSTLDLCGMPMNPPVVSFQCRAQVGDSQEDKNLNRQYVLACSNKQIQTIEPENVVIYGGMQHQEWLEPNLTKGPKYWFLEDWMSVRKRVSTTMRKEKKGS